MQKKAATAASSREQRVKPEPRSTTTAGFSSAFDEQETTARPSPQGRQQQQQQRGRPKGWKAGMAYAEMRGVPGRSSSGEATAARKKPAASAQQGGGGETKRRGRPPRAPGANAREHYLQQNPTYTHFYCEWVEPAEQLASGQWRKERRCPAELQNLETLRRHVYFAHEGDYFTSDGSFVCRWGKCGEKKKTDADAGVEFADQDAFDAHVEWEHLRPFAWHVGDGVQNRGIATLQQEASTQGSAQAQAQAQGQDHVLDPNDDQQPPLPAYLFKDGVQVTPSIRDQRLEDDQRRRERRRKLRRLLIQKDENAPDEEEYVLQTLGLAQAKAQERDGGGRFTALS